jgi:hypothetical protein
MNAQRSFDSSEHLPQRRKSRGVRQQTKMGTTLDTANISSQATPRKRSQVQSNSVYAHRRQGLEVVTKLAAYSTL